MSRRADPSRPSRAPRLRWVASLTCWLLGVACTTGLKPSTTPVPASEVVAHPAQAGAAAADAPPERLTAAPSERLRQLDLERRFGRYQSMDALWVPGQPLLINRDYDFALAFSGGSLGPAVAAARRRDGNARLAELLRRLPRISAEALLKTAALRCVKHCVDPLRSTLYGVLYGERDARLRVIVEVVQADGAILQYISLSSARSVDAYREPGTLYAEFLTGVETIADMLEQGWSQNRGPMGRCAVGERESVEGSVVFTTDAYRVLRAESTGVTAYIACASEALVIEEPSHE